MVLVDLSGSRLTRLRLSITYSDVPSELTTERIYLLLHIVDFG